MLGVESTKKFNKCAKTKAETETVLGYEKLTTVFQWCGKRNKTKKSFFFVAVMFHFYSLSLH